MNLTSPQRPLAAPLFPGRSQTLQAHCEGFPRHLGHSLLAPVRLLGVEALGQLFDYTLELKTPEEGPGMGFSAAAAANLALAALVGQEVRLELEVEGGGPAGGLPAQRQINALIAQASYLRPEGRHHVYALRLRPWLHLAELNQDCRIYQDLSVVQVLEQLLGAYPFALQMRLGQRYPVREYTVQYNESDFAFFERLCQHWGIVWWFEHSQGVHRLVLADDATGFAPQPHAPYRRLAYYPPGHKIDEEYIERLEVSERLSAGQWTGGDVDYTRSRANLGASAHAPRRPGQGGGHHRAEVFAWPGGGAAGASGAATAQPQAGMGALQGPPSNALGEGQRFAQQRLQALQAPSHRACGQGQLRGLLAGHTFELHKHPQQAANIEWLVLSATLDVEDVAQESQGSAARTIVGASASHSATAVAGQTWRCTSTFELQPAALAFRIACTRPKPLALGWQRASVTGPPGQELWTDAYGRVKVHFAWNRYPGAQPPAGNARQPRGAEPINDRAEHTSSCWLRVASAWAGSQYGSICLPRIGQEVIVSFEGGDIDRPLVTGRLFNDLHSPPWALPANQALAGWRSKEIAGAQHNHLALDDTPGQLQAQLASDPGKSQLSLGHITRIDGHQGRQEPRGQGFELRTDGHGAIRAQAGLLITTEARSQASGHITSMAETSARLRQAASAHEHLADLAHQHQAQEASAQAHVAQALHAQQRTIAGGPGGAQAGQPGQGSQGPGASFPEFTQPHLTLASPAGIAATTAHSTHLHAQQHLAITTGKDLSIASTGGWWASVGKAVRLFAHKAGLRMVLGKNDISMQALQDALRFAALMRINERADQIQFIADKSIEFSAADSGTTFDASGITDTTPGQVLHNTASKSFGDAKGMPLEKWTQPYDKQISVKHSLTGEPMPFASYVIRRADGAVETGLADASGTVHLVLSSAAESFDIEIQE